MWIVAWESRLAIEPTDGLANGWRWSVQQFETEVGARLVYESVLPGPNGDFGPVLYRNQALAEVKRRADGELPVSEALLVVRSCCTSGNCERCIGAEGHKYGEPVLVCQFITFLPAMAERVAKNWAAYRAAVMPASENVIGSLCKTSADFVCDKLAHPERINRSMIPKP